MRTQLCVCQLVDRSISGVNCEEINCIASHRTFRAVNECVDEWASQCLMATMVIIVIIIYLLIVFAAINYIECMLKLISYVCARQWTINCCLCRIAPTAAVSQVFSSIRFMARIFTQLSFGHLFLYRLILSLPPSPPLLTQRHTQLRVQMESEPISRATTNFHCSAIAMFRNISYEAARGFALYISPSYTYTHNSSSQW